MKCTEVVRKPVIALLTATLLALPLTGCFDIVTEETVSHTTAYTLPSDRVSEEPDESALPYDVTLQADPSVLIPCEFERVVDGDTIIVHSPDGERLRVRLTGINAPESVHPDENKNTDEGREASDFIKELLSDVGTVYLEYDVEEKDQYDRTLAYVWIDIDGTYVMVNEIMLATGHAEPVYVEPNLKYSNTFKKYEG